MKRIITLFIIFTFLLTIFAACSDSTDSGGGEVGGTADVEDISGIIGEYEDDNTESKSKEEEEEEELEGGEIMTENNTYDIILSSENEDEKENVSKVMETLNILFDGFEKLDGEIAKQAFHPTATWYCTYYKNGTPAESFCDKWVKDKDFMSYFHEQKMIFVDITDNIAKAKFEFYNSLGILKVTSYITLRYNNSSSSWEIINMNNYDKPHNSNAEFVLISGDTDGKIAETFAHLLNGFDAHDGEIVKEAFHSTGTLYCSYYPDGFPLMDYCDKWVVNETNNSNYVRREMLFIDITESVADAKYEFYNVDDVLAITAYFTLRNDNSSSQWKIVNFNYCGHEGYR